MSQLQTSINPTSTSRLLNNLGLAIDEAKLVHTISNLTNQLYRIEPTSGSSSRTRYLRKEIDKLQNQLVETRNRVDII